MDDDNGKPTHGYFCLADSPEVQFLFDVDGTWVSRGVELPCPVEIQHVREDPRITIIEILIFVFPTKYWLGSVLNEITSKKSRGVMQFLKKNEISMRQKLSSNLLFTAIRRVDCGLHEIGKLNLIISRFEMDQMVRTLCCNMLDDGFESQ